MLIPMDDYATALACAEIVAERLSTLPEQPDAALTQIKLAIERAGDLQRALISIRQALDQQIWDRNLASAKGAIQ